MKRETLTKKVDRLAQKYEALAAMAREYEESAVIVRAELIELVREEGTPPPRADKTLALDGERYELRLHQPLEITVDAKWAAAIKRACRRAGTAWVFGRLFRKVERLILADGAHELLDQPWLPKGAPTRLRAMFARAIRSRELPAQLEVRHRDE